MTEGEARLILGLGRDPLDRRSVREAFARTVLRLHPDAGGVGGDLARIRQARGVLERIVEPSDDGAEKCPACRGHGFTMTGAFSVRACGVCLGTGRRSVKTGGET